MSLKYNSDMDKPTHPHNYLINNGAEIRMRVAVRSGSIKEDRSISFQISWRISNIEIVMNEAVFYGLTICSKDEAGHAGKAFQMPLCK